jgi:hypothetical protein
MKKELEVLTGAAGNQVRAGDQSQDRKGARPRTSIVGACPRRRGDRVRQAQRDSRRGLLTSPESGTTPIAK